MWGGGLEPKPGGQGACTMMVQCIMGNGHMGPLCEQTDITENITFPQLCWLAVNMG